jgi:hypothetical protein
MITICGKLRFVDIIIEEIILKNIFNISILIDDLRRQAAGG